MSSPFDPLPNNKAVPEYCRTAEIFRKLYSKNISTLFNPKLSKPEFYEKYSQIIPIDRCLCYFQDLGINLVKKNIASGAAGSVSIVEYKDKKYIIKISKLSGDLTLNKEINFKFNSTNTINFVGLRNFTLDVIATYIINNLFYSQLKVASTAHEYAASICPKFGIQLFELANGGDLNSFVTSTKNITLLEKYGYIQKIGDISLIRRDMLQGMLLQIMTTLLYAKKRINFLHNDLKADNVLISYKIDEKTGKIRFQTKVADFGKSSVKLGNTVIHEHSQTEFDKYDDYFDDNRTYQVPRNFIFIKNKKMALYYQYFDVYVFFISLLLVPTYFNTFFYKFDEKSIYYKCWKVLFPDDKVAREIINRIQKKQKDFTKEKMRTVISIFMGVTLLNNVLPKIVTILKKVE